MYRFFYVLTTKFNRLPTTFLLHFLLILTTSFIILFFYNYNIITNYNLIIFDTPLIQIIAIGLIILFNY